jgi:hypothetical protein
MEGFMDDRQETIHDKVEESLIEATKLYLEQKIITTNSVIAASIEKAKYPLLINAAHIEPINKILDDIQEIQSGIQEFEEKIWFRLLQTYVQNSTKKGHRYAFSESSSVYFWQCAGKTLLTLGNKDDNQFITLITETDSTERNRMGLQGIFATKQMATALLRTACMWTPEANNIIDDEQVKPL